MFYAHIQNVGEDTEYFPVVFTFWTQYFFCGSLE